MRKKVVVMLFCFCSAAMTVRAQAPASQVPSAEEEPMISPARPVPVGKAPGLESKILKDTPVEKVYTIIFHSGDEVLSGLTDFAIAHQIKDAHFTAIGAVQSATLAWLDLSKKSYHKIPVDEQSEVVSLIGDIAEFGGKPVVHMHAVLSKRSGATVGGHVFELNVRPTIEVFMTVDSTFLQKRPDESSGMKLIDPTK
jgi:predicted DNA-binding protein with PD1-like motif